VHSGAGADWRQFRGPTGSGIVPDETAPVVIDSVKDIVWKVEIPGRGLSSPIVVGDRIFLTASSGPKQDRLHVLAFDAKDGKKLWQRTVWATGPTDSHPKSCMAAPTPASDGRRLIALFGTNDLLCLDLDGNVQWIRALYEENSGATDGRGLASSPIIVAETAIALVENQNNSFAAGIDVNTGKNRWRRQRPTQMNWTTPLVLPGKGGAGELVLLQGMTRVSACDPMTGREVWGLDQGAHPIASGAINGTTLYVPANKGLTAFQIVAASPPKTLWEQPKLSPSTASPVVQNGRIYSLRGSILVSGDVKTGEVKSQLRLKGMFSSSLVATGGLLYCFNEEGLAHIVRPGDKDDTLVATVPLGETILCTPAIANGAIYVRSDKHLWKIGKSSQDRN